MQESRKVSTLFAASFLKAATTAQGFRKQSLARMAGILAATGQSLGVSLSIAAGVITLAISLVLLVWQKVTSKSGSSAAQQKAAADTKSAQATDGAHPDKQTVWLMFGSQTGTAERFAKQLRSELETRYGEETHFAVKDIEEYR